MAIMNLAIRGIEGDIGPHSADTFYNDLHKTLKADFILSNPPTLQTAQTFPQNHNMDHILYH